MGYRLEVSKITQVFYGTKLFGNYENEELKSYKWLQDNGYIDYDEYFYFGYGFEGNIVMDVKDFKEFAKVYNDDLNRLEKDYKWFKKDVFINEKAIKKIFKMRDYEKIMISWG